MKADEAIQILKTWRITGDKAHDALDMAIEALQELKNSSQELKNSSDCISRKAAIDAVNTALFPKINTAKDAEKALRYLPSTQPERKKGKWTKDNACEFCGFKPWYERDIHTLSFCPNCGADMRGEQDE